MEPALVVDMIKDVIDKGVNIQEIAGDDDTTEKLANLSSTQTNENLNQMLATKAPKYKHYSTSNSLSYRFNATVAQKNEGHRYVHEVHESVGLSPDNFTIKRATFMDKIRRKYSKLQKTKKCKRRRIELKSEKCNTRQSDIVQIAAVTENETFSAYVMTSKKITPQASAITKLAFFDGQMYYDEVPVESLPPFEVFTNLIAFLSNTCWTQYKKLLIVLYCITN
ncbi:unnamed protein product [Mytilus coruscus]|uniref:Uncharacterized protein n=1 Tax=Mytilus coruscus TaxID=42192 RepID=A0A6J8E329_MYTCO|nr:unnamed protein product [Mytilus coruscus]